MDLPEARKLAQQVVDAQEIEVGMSLTISDTSTRRIQQGWVFYWNTLEAVASNNGMRGLVGQGPLIILDDGRALEGGSAESPDDVLYRFGLIGRPVFDADVEWALWKGSRHSSGGAEYRAKACIETSQPPEHALQVVMTRTGDRSIWRIRFEVASGPHEQLQTGARLILFEGTREVARAQLVQKIPLFRA